MKRSKKIKLTNKAKVLGSIIIISIVLCFLTFIHSTDNLKVEIHEIGKEDNYTLKIDYPELKNKKVNKKAKEYIKSKKDEFLKISDDLKEITDNKLDLSITYTLTDFFDYQALSIVTYSYTGGAHYNKEIKSYYYNVKNNEEVNITNFLEKEESFENLSNLAFNHVINYYKNQNKQYNEDWIREGTKATIDNYSNFLITNDGLKILFTYYQVGPHSDGEIEIIIPENELVGIIKKEYLSIKEQPVDLPVQSNRNLEDFKNKKLIAFTFDDGPSNASTNKLLDNLDKYNARVTFFVLGSRVNSYKESLIRAYEMGNTIGSHTYSHLNLYKLGDADILKEINNTNDAIESIIGVRPNLIRAPYGNINSHIRELSNMYSILWNIDPEDWRYKDAQKIKENIVSHAHDGAIVLLHDIYTTSIDGALLAMEELKDEYAFVTIDEMLELKGITLDKNKNYYNF